MSLDYTLYLLTVTPPETIAARMFPDNATVTFEEGLHIDLPEEQRVSATIVKPRDRDQRPAYIEVEGDPGERLERELPSCVRVSFAFWGETETPAAWNALRAVARATATGTEDLYYTQNQDYLLLTRLDGQLRKHRPQWWALYKGIGGLLDD